MLNISQDIHSLTEFKRRTALFIKQLKEGRRPVILTINGKAALIVQDADSYQKLLEAADRAEAVSALQEGMAQSARGEGSSLKKFDKRMRTKHGIPRSASASRTERH
jgi:PHD/YefM family antitoxin component YafN of YafNO toxin-antitoxin module